MDIFDILDYAVDNKFITRKEQVEILKEILKDIEKNYFERKVLRETDTIIEDLNLCPVCYSELITVDCKDTSEHFGRPVSETSYIYKCTNCGKIVD